MNAVIYKAKYTYIFLRSITGQGDYAKSVCMNTQNSVVSKARGNKFGMGFTVDHGQIESISNVWCHALRLRISIICED